MDGPGRGYQTNRTQELTQITRELKATAKALEVPLLALAQLSRAVDTRDDKRPRLGDLRESGSIEQDADVVMLIYRPAYYMERENPVRSPRESQTNFEERLADHDADKDKVKDTAEILIAKNRHGPTTNDIVLHFDGPGTVFRDDPR